MRSLTFPCTNAPNAPLADAFEVDDFSLDDMQQCCNLQFTGTNASLTGRGELLSISNDEEEMEQDEVNMSSGVINDDSFSEDETGLSKEEEYPELSRTCTELIESESYDFAVMDIEKDMNGDNRKRKANTSTKLKKKRVK